MIGRGDERVGVNVGVVFFVIERNLGGCDGGRSRARIGITTDAVTSSTTSTTPIWKSDVEQYVISDLNRYNAINHIKNRE